MNYDITCDCATVASPGFPVIALDVASLTKEDDGKKPAEKCTAAQENDKRNSRRVEQCSTMSSCYDNNTS